MRLVYRIVLHMSWALSLLLAGWAVLFYLTMIDEINDEVDDSLENYAEMLVTRSLAGRELPAAYSGSNNGYYLHDVSAEYAEGRQHMVFSDEEIFIPEKDEEEPARVLRTIFRDSGGRYKELTVMTPTIEKDDLQEAILWWIVYLYLFLLLAILLVNVLVLHRTLRPLYALLRWFDSYTVGGKNAPLVNDTKVVEFRRLNEAANRYAERAESLFERQKQFIGNASHEMQTPLAICRNRLEMLVDDARTLTGEQLAEIAKVQRTLGHLVRLNRSLLLLSKIENGQFPETGPVDVNALVRRTAGELEEIYAYRGMRCTVSDRGRLVVRMNPSLAESVVGNLLKNAFVHGDVPGEVAVEIAPDALRISNGGAAGPLDAGHIFDRFYRVDKARSRETGGTGLGLSIVKQIVRLHAGTVTVASEYGKGTTFTVQLPVK